MLKRASFIILLGVLLAVAFAYGVARLFILRYEEGDVYPPYSSLRADPVGAKGVYEALGQLAGVGVRRNYKPLPKLNPEGPVTLVYAGVARYAMWEPRELIEFDRLILSGSRAVCTFRPFERSLIEREIAQEEKDARTRKEKKRAEEEEKRKRETSEKKGKPKARKSEAGKDHGEESPGPSFLSFDEVAKHLGFGFDFLPPSEERKFERRATRQDGESPMEEELSWHSALYFKNLKPDWKVLYTCENQPVVIERRYGRGTIVMASDSYFLSNEALRAERRPQFLARLFDGPGQIVFDEEHHGVRDDPGVASLARKYRLHGVVAGLVLLAGLFVWKSVVRFLPPHEAGDRGSDVVGGKESAEGFVNLLWRTIPPARIIEVCASEWRKAFAQKPRELAIVEELCAQEQARPARERDPVGTYRAISRALSRR